MTGLFCLVAFSLLAGEKSVKFGSGYKAYEYLNKESLLHSGRYFYGGYSYEFGDFLKNKVQFQVSNSNRSIKLEIPYVTASTAASIHYDFAVRTLKFNNSNHYLGIFIANNFDLNFFPKLDRDNFLWVNQSFTGIKMMNQFQINENSRIDFSAHIPLYSNIFYNRVDRFSGEIPSNRPNLSVWGTSNKLFNGDAEIGYVNSKQIINWGVFYQYEINRFSLNSSNSFLGQAHSLSLRILY